MLPSVFANVTRQSTLRGADAFNAPLVWDTSKVAT